MSGEGIWQSFELLRDQDVLTDIDIGFARFLQEKAGNVPDNVLLAACLTSYYFRQGNVCLLLEEVAGKRLFDEAENGVNMTGPALSVWLKDLKGCPAVGEPGTYTPLILDKGNRLYLHKLWRYEQDLAEGIIRRSEVPAYKIDEHLLTESLTRLFGKAPGGETDWQQIAAVAAAMNRFTIISGGPGTGKTSTVVRILALLLEQAGEKEKFPSIALAAPTGKAAARLKDSILSIRESLPVSDDVREAIPTETKTLHQLLGARRHSSAFRYNRENPLPHDLVIVDEASMVDQALMSKLLNALLEDTRLILLGDKDQLASVEAGSVMGDLCAINENRLSKEFAGNLRDLGFGISDSLITKKKEVLTDHIILLTKSYRFGDDSGIARLAETANRGDADSALEILKSDQYPEVNFMKAKSAEEFGSRLEKIAADYFEKIIKAPSPDEAYSVFNIFKVLAAHRRGPRGVSNLNQVIESILQHRGYISGYEAWYPGKPVIINENDYSLGLHNGDTGICLTDANGDLKVFVSHEGELRPISPSRLPDHSLAFALTVHKSQGSEFDRILLILPNRLSRILTRELLYTAITRARKEVVIGGDASVLAEGIRSRLKRTSGLQDQLWRRLGDTKGN